MVKSRKQKGGTPPPTAGITTGAITDTTIVLNFTPQSYETAYKIDVSIVANAVSGYPKYIKKTDLVSNTYTLTGLTKNTSYNIKVTSSQVGVAAAAASATNPGAYTDTSTSIVAKTVDTSAAITTGTITDTSVVLNFTPQSDETAYKIEVSPSTTEYPKYIKKTDLVSNAYTLTGLTKNTDYTITLSSSQGTVATAPASITNPGAYNDVPRTVTAKTVDTTAAITVGTIADTRIILNFTPQTNETAYMIDVSPTAIGYPKYVKKMYLSSTNTYPITGLTKNTSYTITVRSTQGPVPIGEASATNPGAYTNVPRTVTAKTVDTSAAITTGTITDTSVVLNFTPQSDETAYKIEVSPSTTGYPKYIKKTDLVSNAYTLTGLTQTKDYTITVTSSQVAVSAAAASATNPGSYNDVPTSISATTLTLTKNPVTNYVAYIPKYNTDASGDMGNFASANQGYQYYTQVGANADGPATPITIYYATTSPTTKTTDTSSLYLTNSLAWKLTPAPTDKPGVATKTYPQMWKATNVSNAAQWFYVVLYNVDGTPYGVPTFVINTPTSGGKSKTRKSKSKKVRK